jgi:protein-disulfide isomerase
VDLLLVGLVFASLGIAGVLLGVSVGILHHLCLLCLAADAIIVAWFIAVAPLVSRFETAGAHWWQRRGVARATAAACLVAAAAGGTWATAREPGSAATAEQVRARDPEFYRWYSQLPVRPVSELVSPGCHTKGPAEAAIAIVEFSDFQCPYCVQAFFDLRDVLRKRSDIRLVFRHFPLDSTCNSRVTRTLHPGACLAACAAECAGAQGRFWEYHDLLFENHERLQRDNLFRFAREMKLDLAAFGTCLDDPATLARVGGDVQAGARVGVNSTPTLFINGRTVDGALERTHYDYALAIEEHAREARSAGGAS